MKNNLKFIIHPNLLKYLDAQIEK